MGETTERIDVGVRCEWDKAKTVLVFEPGQELYLGGECPLGSLFEGPLDCTAAIREHQQFTQALRERGIRVINLRDVLLSGAAGNGKDGVPLDTLKDLAQQALQYEYRNLLRKDRIEFENQKEFVIEMASPEQLLSIILRRPRRSIETVPQHTGYTTLNGSYPLYNVMFLRDQMITTDKGVVIGAMNSLERKFEVDIIRAALGVLGISPILYFDREESPRLEGGDFIPAGEYALIGVGARTNSEGVERLLDNAVMGYDRVYVVKHPRSGQEEMHLDTYFNFVGEKRAILLEDRKDTPVDTFVREGGVYKRSGKERTLVEMLGEEDVLVRQINKTVQMLYGCNLLTLGPRDFVSVNMMDKVQLKDRLETIGNRLGRQVGGAFSQLSRGDIMQAHLQYVAILSALGYDDLSGKLLNATHLNRAWGGFHCVTQVVHRGKE